MSDRADAIAATHIRVLANDEGTWGIDAWSAWFPCDGDSKEDVVSIAADVRRGVAAALRAYAEEARQEEREACAKIAEAVKGGFTSNIRIDESEQEMVRDPDGPWVLNSDVAAAIRAREGKR